MKKVIYTFYIILFAIFFHLGFRYILNEKYIGDYNNGDYDNSIVNFLLTINYPEQYVAYYNKGNNYYNLKEYEDAIKAYESALRTVKGDKRCMVLINLTLSKLELIDLNKTDARSKLVEARDTLTDSNCATRDNNGTNETAQDLYNKIDEILKAEGGGGGGTTGDDPPEEKPPEDYDNLEKKLKEQQQRANDERKNVQQKNGDYYNGKKW